MAGTNTFNLYDALNGALVTVSGHKEYTGRLVKEGSGATQYVVYFGGSKVIVNESGLVKVCTPSLTGVTVDLTVLIMYSDSIDDDLHFKARGDIPSDHQETGYTNEVELKNVQLRDQFAMTALRVIMEHVDHPESADDEKCLHYSRVAYQWAAGMMQAALESREGVKVPEEDQSDEKTLVAVDTSELATSTEKLLYNIAATLENIKKQDQDHYDDTHTEDDELKISIAALEDMMTQNDELKVKVTDIPDIDIETMPSVTISGTPNVNVSNTPSVTVSGTPSVNVSNTVDIQGTVSVDNFPESSESNNE